MLGVFIVDLRVLDASA